MNKPVNEWTLGDLRKWMQEHDADVSFYRTGDMWMAHVVYRIGDDVLVPGRAEYQRALGMIQECEASGLWPGYATEVVDMSIPAWATKRIFGDDGDWGVE